jgi:Rrf2 family protein
LTRGGILRSHRGIGGGYSLAQTAEQITLRDLAELLEGIAVERCSLSLGSQCPFQADCKIKNKLHEIEDRFLESLEEVNIKQIAAEIVVRFPKRTRA